MSSFWSVVQSPRYKWPLCVSGPNTVPKQPSWWGLRCKYLRYDHHFRFGFFRSSSIPIVRIALTSTLLTDKAWDVTIILSSTINSRSCSWFHWWGSMQNEIRWRWFVDSFRWQRDSALWFHSICLVVCSMWELLKRALQHIGCLKMVPLPENMLAPWLHSIYLPVCSIWELSKRALQHIGCLKMVPLRTCTRGPKPNSGAIFSRQMRHGRAGMILLVMSQVTKGIGQMINLIQSPARPNPYKIIVAFASELNSNGNLAACYAWTFITWKI